MELRRAQGEERLSPWEGGHRTHHWICGEGAAPEGHGDWGERVADQFDEAVGVGGSPGGTQWDHRGGNGVAEQLGLRGTELRGHLDDPGESGLDQTGQSALGQAVLEPVRHEALGVWCRVWLGQDRLVLVPG